MMSPSAPRSAKALPNVIATGKRNKSLSGGLRDARIFYTNLLQSRRNESRAS
jgi:hypothetical protein